MDKQQEESIIKGLHETFGENSFHFTSIRQHTGFDADKAVDLINDMLKHNRTVEGWYVRKVGRVGVWALRKELPAPTIEKTPAEATTASELGCPPVSTPEPKPKGEATSENYVTKIQKQPQPNQPSSSLPQRRISLSTHRHNHHNRTPQDDVNWVEIASEVAKRLKGEPDSVISKGKILCWGRKQSFKVYTEQGSFSDFEADVYGGVIKMVEHVLGYSRSQALTWLSDHGFISKRNGTRYQSHTPSRPKQSPKKPAAPQKNQPKSKGKLNYGLKLWNASEPISLDSTHPARRWLNNRNLIPIDKQAPEAIRWHKGKHYNGHNSCDWRERVTKILPKS